MIQAGFILLLIKSYEIGHFWILDPSFPKCEKFHYDIHFFSIKNLLKFFLSAKTSFYKVFFWNIYINS